MKTAWILTNKPNTFVNNKSGFSYGSGSYFFWSNRGLTIPSDDKNSWFIDGYVVPRQHLDESYTKLQPEVLCESLFKKYSDDFIHRIKGNFVVIRLSRDSFSIYSDHFGIQKFFCWQRQNEFIVSNDLKIISKLVRLKPSSYGMAVYALAYHFTGGLTAFEHVYHNQPAECIYLQDGRLKFRTYWHPERLLALDSDQVSIKEISASLKAATYATLDSSKPVSLSLTGGADTRNLLSIFLSMETAPHLYTYGNPLSNDCLKARSIAKGLGLQHQIYDIQMTADNFEAKAKEIIRYSGGLASIHRVHRLLAVEYEKQFANQMYLGTLGGEFIKGVSEDDYIVPAIVFENWDKSLLESSDLDKYLAIKRVVVGQDLKVELFLYFGREPFINGPVVNRKLSALSFITAHLHDAQDVNLYKTVIDRVYTPFIDIDYLETLFSSQYTFNRKEMIQNPYLRRIQNPVYGSNFLNVTHPPLLNFKYCGEHKPSEVCFNKYLAALLKGIRQKLTPAYPPNFPLGAWMVEFVENNLPLCQEIKAVKNVFDIDSLQQDFKNENHGHNEAYWLKYTNPIMMRFLIEEFCR